LRQKYGAQKTDALTKEIAERLPKNANIADADKYAAEYRKASQEFEQESERFGGVWDVLKALMLIQPRQAPQREPRKARNLSQVTARYGEGGHRSDNDNPTLIGNYPTET
jgi:hypothetical protein